MTDFEGVKSLLGAVQRGDFRLRLHDGLILNAWCVLTGIEVVINYKRSLLSENRVKEIQKMFHRLGYAGKFSRLKQGMYRAILEKMMVKD